MENLELKDLNVRTLAIHRPSQRKGNEMNAIIIMVLRQALLTAGGALAAHGIIAEGQIEAFIGIGLSVGAAVWKWIELWLEKRNK